MLRFWAAIVGSVAQALLTLSGMKPFDVGHEASNTKKKNALHGPAGGLKALLYPIFRTKLCKIFS